MDEQEIEALKARADELEQFKNESAPKLQEFVEAKEQWMQKEKEYQEQINPNWKATRERMAVLEKLAKDRGVEFEKDGTPKSEDKYSKEEVIRSAQEATRKEFLNNKLDELLEPYTAEEAKVVRKQFEKLTAGEEVNMQNIRSFVQSAEGASGFQGESRISRVSSVSGQGPRYQDKADDKLDDATAKSVASLMGLKLGKNK